MRLLFSLICIFCSSLALAQGVAVQGNKPGIYTEDSINELNLLSRNLLDEAPEKSFELGKKALEASQARNFKQGIAEAMTNLGFYFQDQAKYTNAFEYFTSAQQIYHEMQDTLMLARSLRNLGGLYRQRSLYPQAELYYQEALSIGMQTNDSAIIGHTLKDLGGLAYLLKAYNKALNYLNNSQRYITAEKNPAIFAAILNNMGVVQKAMGNYKPALKNFKDSHALLKTQNNIRDLSPVLMNIGEVYQKIGDPDKAELHYLQALAAAKKVNNIQRLVESYEYLSNFYAKLEDYHKAYQYKTLYTAYKDSSYRQATDMQMAKIAKELELERKERAFSKLMQDKELQLLNREYEINQLELNRKNNLILYSLLLIVLILGGAFVLYRSYRIKRQQNEQLADKNGEIISKNEQLQEMNERLQSSEKQLRSLNETKDMFFGIVAHDLRSPLMTLKGFVQLLNQGQSRLNPAEMSKLTGRIEHSLQGITSLLDNLLQWSTTQTGLIEFAPRVLKLDKVLEDNLQLLGSTAEVKNIEIRTNIGASTLLADKQMLYLIIRNLLANAIKFTPRGGLVTISTSEDEQATYIKINDTGIGMSEEDIEKLLAEGMLRSNRGTENEKGSGLGLWLCKEFLERHNGKLSAESIKGEGTTFIVQFPKKGGRGAGSHRSASEQIKKPA